MGDKGSAKVDEATRIRGAELLEQHAARGVQTKLREVDQFAGALTFAIDLGIIERPRAARLMSKFCGLDPG